MKKSILFFLVFALIFASCSKKAEKQEVPAAAANPFFLEYATPFQVPPFDLIKEEHYLPAFQEGMKRQQAEVQTIVASNEPPTFANTIETLERTGALLRKVESVFFNLTSANTNDQMQKIAKDVAPLLAKHTDDILLNAGLFQRIKDVYEQKDALNLAPEPARLLEKMYKSFVRNGANLNAEQQSRLRKINEELSVLSVKFGENVLKEDNNFELVIDKEEDLTGLPASVIAGAAKAKGYEGKWRFTLHKPSLIPFLQFSAKRELREKIYKAYINRGDNNNEFDNKAIASKMAALRVERAALLGYKTHADYILEDNMAKTPVKVLEFLNRLWKPGLVKTKQEAKELQAMIRKEGNNFKLESWDWWYYAEKLRKAKYDLDENTLRPYFKLENVLIGAFDVANKLFGLTFTERTDIPKYHPDVRTFEAKEADGSHVGIFYVDYFPRPSKRGGAWSNDYRAQSRMDGKMIHPVITNVGNFSKPAGDKPPLLSFEEVQTLFHEFGHALHGLLSNVTYESLAGTSVPRDFVELPSQIMENWAGHPEVLKMYAKHYETGEPISEELITKIEKSSLFNLGFITTEYLAASFLDMDWHTLTEPVEQDTLKFEAASLGKIGLIPEIISRYRSTYFNHIFSGGYSSGYYSYIWAEVLDSDAFEAFKEEGLFDPETALAFRKYILETGGTDEPMNLYKKFRGAEPKIDALLKKRGLNVN